MLVRGAGGGHATVGSGWRGWPTKPAEESSAGDPGEYESERPISGTNCPRPWTPGSVAILSLLSWIWCRLRWGGGTSLGSGTELCKTVRETFPAPHPPVQTRLPVRRRRLPPGLCVRHPFRLAWPSPTGPARSVGSALVPSGKMPAARAGAPVPPGGVLSSRLTAGSAHAEVPGPHAAWVPPDPAFLPPAAHCSSPVRERGSPGENRVDPAGDRFLPAGNRLPPAGNRASPESLRWPPAFDRLPPALAWPPSGAE
jgi:hypothetical protein